MAISNPSEREIRESFADPPSQYGPIDCWWWDAGVLDEEKMTWQLEEMKRKGISGTWYYPRLVGGEALEPEPAYWTDKWWDFFRFSMQEHKRLGLVAWTTDWPGVAGAGRAGELFQNKLREQREIEPWLWGRRLVMYKQEAQAPGALSLEIEEGEEFLWTAAFVGRDHGLDEESRRDVRADDRTVTWQAPEAGWILTAVVSQPYDLDYMNEKISERWIETLLVPHERNLKDHIGTTLQGYGTDELIVLKGNILYSKTLLERFKSEKGYDPLPMLAGLFIDLGTKTDQIRCEYYDVMISMLEENLFEPFARWLHDRDMLYAEFCPNGKWLDMLGQTYHYGDFFRYMRHYDYPGNEEDTNRTRTFQAKLVSSISHLYERGRTGLCAYWGSGWGHNTEENLKWTNENYAYGINLYNRHGVLYSTLGGWYEWVPPSVHFRQPYWKQWKSFTDHIRRLSYLLSQGRHVADVAILYPVTTIQADWFAGNEFGAAADDAAATAFSLARTIYDAGIDLDFIDFESLQRAKVEDGLIKVSGLEFPVVILPPMTTIRSKTLEKIKEFWAGGGVVIAFRRLPGASAENGREDPEIRKLLREIFGLSSTAAHHHPGRHRVTALRMYQNDSAGGGRAFFVPSEATKFYRSLSELISSTIVLDFAASLPEIFHTHQRTEDLDIYFVFNNKNEERSVEITFRASGQPEIWDTFSGKIRKVHRIEHLLSSNRTRVRLTMEPNQGVLVVFADRSSEMPELLEDNLTEIAEIQASDEGILVRGFSDLSGRKSFLATLAGQRFKGEARIDPPPGTLALDGLWRFSLEPTMDNRWGDFRYPAAPDFIGAEARRFKYMTEGETPGSGLGWYRKEFSDAAWPEHTYTYGPYWWDSGLLKEAQVTDEFLQNALHGEIDPERWSWYHYSQKFGSEDKEVHNADAQGLFGVSDSFLVFDETGSSKDSVRYLFTYIGSDRDREMILDFGGRELYPRVAWVNGIKVLSIDREAETQLSESNNERLNPGAKVELREEATAKIVLKKGSNPVLLEITHPGGQRIWTYAAFYEPGRPPATERFVPLLKWSRENAAIRHDIFPEAAKRVGWYRFEAPPGTKSMTLHLTARSVEAWVDGDPVEVNGDTITLVSRKERVSQVAVRIEHEPGRYGGAAFEQPVSFDCESGLIALGDWCDHALRSYSGAGVYRTTFQISPDRLEGKAVLDLGRVNSTAEVTANGKSVGIRMASPYTFDLSRLLKEGENAIEVRVHNTLANHYDVGYPSKWVHDGQTLSGLIGPANIRFLREVVLHGDPA